MGFLLLIETLMLLSCAGVSLFYREDDLMSFLQSGGITAFVGFLFLLIGRGAEKQLGRRDGCHRNRSLDCIFAFWNAPFLVERIYSLCNECFF